MTRECINCGLRYDLWTEHVTDPIHVDFMARRAEALGICIECGYHNGRHSENCYQPWTEAEKREAWGR